MNINNQQQQVNKIKHKHYKWTPVEDQRLKEIIMTCGTKNWAHIASQIPNRNSRQCQERWEYYLSPNLNNSPWSEDEDRLLEEKFAEFGSKWTVIAKFFNGRTNTNVKNRYLALCRGGLLRSQKSQNLTPKNDFPNLLKQPISSKIFEPAQELTITHVTSSPEVNIERSPSPEPNSSFPSKQKLPTILLFSSVMPTDFLQSISLPNSELPFLSPSTF